MNHRQARRLPRILFIPIADLFRRKLLPLIGITLMLVFALGLTACKKPQPALQGARVASQADQEPTPPPPARKRVLEAPLWTQTVAVLDTRVNVTAPRGVDTEFTRELTESVEAAFLSTGRFDLVERARLDTVKGELASTSDSLYFDQTTVAKMGKFLGARYIIIPNARMEVGLWGTRLDLMVKVLDTETASIVQTIPCRTTSNALSTNSSITACMDRIRIEVMEAIAPIYPAQAMIVHSPKADIFWAEAKQGRFGFKPGQKVRILEAKEVFNSTKGTRSPFLVEVGRGRVQSVEAFGVIVRAPGVKTDEGSIIEAIL
jgi:hypothetical protein